MPNKDKFVLVRPEWSDLACKYGWYYYGLIKDDATRLGIAVTDLEKELARKIPLQEAIARDDPLLFSGVGHGNADIYSGQEREILMQTCSGDEILAGRITYLLSCMTARTLGNDIVTKGGKAYLGYYTSYTWVTSSSGRDIPGDLYDKPFYDTSNAICYLINRNAKTDFVKQAIMEQARRWVAYWEQSGDPAASSVITWLINDYLDPEIDPLRHYGTPSRIEEPSRDHMPILQVVRLGSVDKGGTMKVQVMLTCPTGCDISAQGQKVQIYDGTGALQGEIQLNHYANGANYSDVVDFAVPNELGRFTWKAVYEADGVHSRVEAEWIFITMFDVVLTGRVTVRDIGQPIGRARVSIIGNGSVYANNDGIYSVSFTTTSPEISLNASYSGYNSQSKKITVTGSGTYEVNFDLAPVLSRKLTLSSSPVGVTFRVDRLSSVNSGATISLSEGYHLIEAPSEVVVGDKSYRFLSWEDNSIDPRRLIWMSRDFGINAIYEEVGMAVIHKESFEPWTFTVVGEVHETRTKMVQKFTEASPGEAKQVIVGTVCLVNGQPCNLIGKAAQIRDHQGNIVAQSTFKSWDTNNQCYISDLIPVTAPVQEGTYTWMGQFPKQ